MHIPPELSGAITGVFGLNNHRVLRRKSRTAPLGTASMASPDMAAKARAWFMPAELASIYNFPAANAQQQCLGLLEFGGGVSTSDVTAYFAKVGAPAPTVTVVALDGVSTDPTGDPDSTGEVMLDVDVAGCLAGGAKIAAYFSTFDEKGLVDCLAAVVADSTNDPSVVSISWGWAENQPFNNTGVLWSPAAIQHCDESFLAAAQLGITICVSTGDDGAEAQVQDGMAHVNYPATSPYVLAVGGTTLHARQNAGGTAQVTETVWNDGPGSGTGGGVSDITPVPSWQEGKVPPSINTGSISSAARSPTSRPTRIPATGYLTMSGGKLGIVGGTSASAPLWASLITRINAITGKRTGNFNALLYATLGPNGVLRDITVGNNDTGGMLNGAVRGGPVGTPPAGGGVAGRRAAALPRSAGQPDELGSVLNRDSI